MALSEIEQVKAVSESSKYILLAFNTTTGGDAVAAATALKAFFEKQGKQVDIACDNFSPAKNLRFLPHIDTIKKDLSNLQKFIIKVDVSQAPIETISYDVKDGTLSIYLTPKHGVISKNELRTGQSTFKYDLIITLGSQDLESLGGVFHNNTDLFYRTTIMNIDYQASNERFGQVNVVDLTATSVSEVAYKILKHIPTGTIDTEIATSLLTGMIVATKSFKNPNITPHTLHLASQLIDRGAERERIVHNLYRTHSLSTLKLWGQALTHLEHHGSTGLITTVITREDFTRTGADVEDLHGIIEELISNSPEAKIITVLYEVPNTEKEIGALMSVDKNFDALLLTKRFGGSGTKRHTTFRLTGKTLQEAKDEIVNAIKENVH